MDSESNRQEERFGREAEQNRTTTKPATGEEQRAEGDATPDVHRRGLYILGPVIGGVLAALLYDRTMAQSEAPQ